MIIINGRVYDGDDYDGDIGTVIEGNAGTVHLGTGNVYNNSQVITGDGVTYINGDNPDGIRKTFGGKRGKRS
ncbi:hypothetical protein ACFQVD_44720 [Streptosporangium amethystogenes subsp. fukuiense]|uniref:Uncharacterized protein n=1 Tax=Streptosporangium amethystogenes subsp. fukuiense TaxID=698418 RepID=A0ABW2THJ1_9ACTN